MQVDIIDFMKTIILMLLNTIVEFLPISSTAHFIIFNKLIKIKSNINLIMAISQMAIIISLIYYFYEYVIDIIVNFFKKKEIRFFCYNIIIATLTTIIFGFIFHKMIKKYFFNVKTIAIFLILFGIIMIYIDKHFNKENKILCNLYSIPKNIMYKIGVFQAISLLPGISRSASTICGAIYYGLSNDLSVDFSFFMSIPVSFAGSVFDIYKNFNVIDNYLMIFIFFILNIMWALFLVKKMIEFLKKHSLKNFGFYRIVIGFLILLFKF